MFKKSIVTFTLVSALAANIAFANTTQTQMNTQVSELAGIQAESVLHPVDEAIEKIQLLLTAEGESKADLLNTISQERIAELKLLNQKHKQKYVYKLIKRYLHTVAKLEKQLQIALEQKEDVQNLIKELNKQQSEISKTLTEALEELPTKEQNEMKPKIEESKESQQEAIEVVEIVETGKNDEAIKIEDSIEKPEEKKTDESTKEESTEKEESTKKEELKKIHEEEKQLSRSEQYQRVQKQSHGKAKAYGLIKNNKNVSIKEDEKNEKKVKKEKRNKKELKKELKKNEK